MARLLGSPNVWLIATCLLLLATTIISLHRAAQFNTAPVTKARNTATFQLDRNGLPKLRKFNRSEPAIFVITPTYFRKSQLVDLHRMSHSLYIASLKHNLLWIVVEDSDEKTDQVRTLLSTSSLTNHVHLAVKEHRTGNVFKASTQRNLGIEYIRRLGPHPDSKAYFGDDDNAYAIDLFDEIAKVQSVGVWPVAYSGARRVEYPKLNDQGKVVSFFAYAPSFRLPYPLDMAGFAVSVKYFLRDDPVKFEELAPTSTGENRFLKATGIKMHELEPLADMCTRVLVWHVKTYTRSESKYDADTAQFNYV
eukprot:TRINITY_DN5957_c0_g1_i1.p1 TRINITY_DN5957_c0_g1~~TRINITY_DN5957_c0_g1_i1.p1  ORF type:complete len:307 (+),score=81.10 TRINITY_DN5957_c0_g1_i1:108-1028(+)